MQTRGLVWVHLKREAVVAVPGSTQHEQLRQGGWPPGSLLQEFRGIVWSLGFETFCGESASSAAADVEGV